MNTLLRERDNVVSKLQRFASFVSNLVKLQQDNKTISPAQATQFQKRSNIATTFLCEFEVIHTKSSKIATDLQAELKVFF